MQAKKIKIDAFKKQMLTTNEQTHVKGGKGPMVDPVG